MRTVGEQIRLARLRRNLSVAQVAERATCSPLTVARIEKGTPTVLVCVVQNNYLIFHTSAKIKKFVCRALTIIPDSRFVECKF